MLKRVLAAVVLGMAFAVAQAEDIKVSGFVKGDPKGDTFVVGSRSGTYTIDCKKAKVSLKSGKKLEVSKLTGGSQVTIEGELKGKDRIEATTVVCGNLRGEGAIPKKDDKDEEKAPKKKKSSSKKDDDQSSDDKKDEDKKPSTKKKSDDKKDEDKKSDEKKSEDKKEPKKSTKKKSDTKKDDDKKKDGGN